MCACRAPEQVDAEFGCLGTHTDVWGFATCILHLATGQLPYQDLNQIQMVSAMLKGRALEVSTNLPDWLQHVLRQALTFDAAARPSVAMLHKVHTPRTLQLSEWGWFALIGHCMLQGLQEMKAIFAVRPHVFMQSAGCVL